MALGRAAGRLSQLFGRAGSALPGLIAEKVDPRFIEKLVTGLKTGVVVVTGTNGKTTTTKMLVGILEAEGMSVVTNRTGSNLARGIATHLMRVASWGGRIDADMAVFEVDEAAVRTLSPRLAPHLIIVTNLARDQLDRFGELATTAEHVAAAVRHADVAVLNADDPLVAEMAASGVEPRLFGAAPQVRRLMPADSNLYGDEAESDSQPELLACLESTEAEGYGERIELTLGGERLEVHLQVPGTYNGYNAAAALLASMEYGVHTDRAVAALEAIRPAFGRGQVIEYRNRRVRLLLVKNPAGFNQIIQLLGGLEVSSVLIAINDLDADGRDVSWLWDARLEDLATSGHQFGTSGIRAYDMGLRLKYAGIRSWNEPDLAAALDRLVDSAAEGETVVLVPTYTAMLPLHSMLLPGTSKRETWT
jgi:UDP-N-acetylmuramyl tripeptide synthase